jgi:hypothetical protein
MVRRRKESRRRLANARTAGGHFNSFTAKGAEDAEDCNGIGGTPERLSSASFATSAVKLLQSRR